MRTKDILIALLVGIGGGILGSIIAHKYAESRIIDIPAIPEDEEIPVPKIKKKETNLDIKDYANKLKEENYIQYSMASSGRDTHFMSADEFANDTEYDKETLTVYSDKVVTDADYNVIEVIQALIGVDVDEGFDKSEEKDAFYVRNDLLKVDYELVKEDMTYGELLKQHPYLLEDYM